MAETIRRSVVDVEGLRDFERVLRKVGKEARQQARDRTNIIATKLANVIKRGHPSGERYAFLAQTVRSRRGDVPKVAIGGAKRANLRRHNGRSPMPRAGDLVFGMEFGASRPENAWRFPPRAPRNGRGNYGYWIYRQAEQYQPQLVDEWERALEPLLKEWARGSRR